LDSRVKFILNRFESIDELLLHDNLHIINNHALYLNRNIPFGIIFKCEAVVPIFIDLYLEASADLLHLLGELGMNFLIKFHSLYCFKLDADLLLTPEDLVQLFLYKLKLRSDFGIFP
jgi:hypothetical protein